MLSISYNVLWKVYSWINAYIYVIIIKIKYTELKNLLLKYWTNDILINKTSVILI